VGRLGERFGRRHQLDRHQPEHHRAIINWNTFNIGAGETTTFVQPNSSSVALNRVTAGSALGDLRHAHANGYVFVINRDGVLVGPVRRDQHRGLPGLDPPTSLTPLSWRASQLQHRGTAQRLDHQPRQHHRNERRLRRTGRTWGTQQWHHYGNAGHRSLASATAHADLYGDKLIQLSPTDQIANQVIDVIDRQGRLTSLVTNEGKLSAIGGRVELTAAAARRLRFSDQHLGCDRSEFGWHAQRPDRARRRDPDSKGAGAPTQTVKVSGTISASGKQRAPRAAASW